MIRISVILLGITPSGACPVIKSGPSFFLVRAAALRRVLALHQSFSSSSWAKKTIGVMLALGNQDISYSCLVLKNKLRKYHISQSIFNYNSSFSGFIMDDKLHQIQMNDSNSGDNPEACQDRCVIIFLQISWRYHDPVAIHFKRLHLFSDTSHDLSESSDGPSRSPRHPGVCSPTVPVP